MSALQIANNVCCYIYSLMYHYINNEGYFDKYISLFTLSRSYIIFLSDETIGSGKLYYENWLVEWFICECINQRWQVYWFWNIFKIIGIEKCFSRYLLIKWVDIFIFHWISSTNPSTMIKIFISESLCIWKWEKKSIEMK